MLVTRKTVTAVTALAARLEWAAMTEREDPLRRRILREAANGLRGAINRPHRTEAALTAALTEAREWADQWGV